ncbi:MAG: tryptophan 2,3-dioxygenase [Halobacteriovoraceae bacterium]|nr:tryptophan 2,3-dioxygenase [Halobacteriovoraceae bacterium]|tara:strand:+ start:7777 stop:8859 length:1083 start_codon:yes stop_codon:yes gene_type:complete
MKYDPIYYGDYLQLDTLLSSQKLKSLEHGKEAHDETLFIITHQAYELWFKQIIHELDSVHKIFNTSNVNPTHLGVVNHRLQRIVQIQRVLNEQIAIIETMTPLDFMEFRDYLVPASGFQSIQFREIELKLGLRQRFRLGIDQKFFNSRLKEEHKEYMIKLEEESTFLELFDAWLSRMPFGQTENFDFWQEYQNSVNKMLEQDRKIIMDNKTLHDKEKEFELKNLEATRNSFAILFDEEKYNALMETGEMRISRKAKLSAIFINLFKDEPIFQIPNRMVESLLDIDEMFSTWRYRHAIMVHRILGTKIGTGGSSGHDYLKRSTENNRVFLDFFNLATFLIPKNFIPALPSEIKKEMGFHFE